MVSLHRGGLQLCNYIQLFLWTSRIFPHGLNLYQKITIFRDTHIQVTTVKFGKRVMRTCDSLPQAKFGKNHLRG